MSPIIVTMISVSRLLYHTTPTPLHWYLPPRSYWVNKNILTYPIISYQCSHSITCVMCTYTGCVTGLVTLSCYVVGLHDYVYLYKYCCHGNRCSGHVHHQRPLIWWADYWSTLHPIGSLQLKHVLILSLMSCVNLLLRCLMGVNYHCCLTLHHKVIPLLIM